MDLPAVGALMPTTSVSLTSTFRDLYPGAGTRLKQWVVDLRKRIEWERETCPRVDVAEHDDNCGSSCRNVGGAPWTHLAHDCCEVCCDLHEATAQRPDVVAWLAERDALPPMCTDRDKLSDEVEPDHMLRNHPLLAMVRR